MTTAWSAMQVNCGWYGVTGRLLPAAAVRMAGRHNLTNALAALALGEAAGLPLDAMLDTLTEFQGLPHRMQFVAEQDGVRWYNDSKGTNVGATLAAIAGIDSGAGADCRR